jgi:hypothetical protein
LSSGFDRLFKKIAKYLPKRKRKVKMKNKKHKQIVKFIIEYIEKTSRYSRYIKN